MRAARSAKFAEYTSTYAILNSIGIHETALIERRDASAGMGVFVRDACDADTTLFVVPAHRICATSVMAKIGTHVAFHCPPELTTSSSNSTAPDHLDGGLVTFLTGSGSAAAWVELCWRLALERHRSYSLWWGWLESIPPPEEFAGTAAGALSQCRAVHTPLHPFYAKARKRLEEEKTTAYAMAAAGNLAPSYANFSWAVDALVSRGVALPRCWSPPAEEAPGAAEAPPLLTVPDTELGIVPYVDLINGPDGIGRAANATVEVAADAEDLPEWYLQWILHEAKLKGRDGAAELTRILSQRYCVCVTLKRPLRASEEVILPYDLSPMTTKVLSEAEDELLTRLLKFGY